MVRPIVSLFFISLAAPREYIDRRALVIGLIIVATIVTIAAFGTKLLARWTSLNASMD
jgi:Flp pilus assembly pilin Flp